MKKAAKIYSFYELQRSFVQLCPVHRSYICKDDSSQTKNTSTGNKLILRIMFSFQMYEILNWGTDQIRGIDLEWPQWICNPWAEPAYLGFCKYLVELRFFRIFKLAHFQHIFSMGLQWSPAEVLFWSIVVKGTKDPRVECFCQSNCLNPIWQMANGRFLVGGGGGRG